MIKDKIVFGTSDQRVKERLLMKSNLTLQAAEGMCRAAEISKQQIESMISTSQTTEVHMVARNRHRSKINHIVEPVDSHTYEDNVQQKERCATSAKVKITSPQSAATSRTNTGSHDTQSLKNCIPSNKAQITTMKPPTAMNRVTTQTTSPYFVM